MIEISYRTAWLAVTAGVLGGMLIGMLIGYALCVWDEEELKRRTREPSV